jgi:hypothetical protein
MKDKGSFKKMVEEVASVFETQLVTVSEDKQEAMIFLNSGLVIIFKIRGKMMDIIYGRKGNIPMSDRMKNEKAIMMEIAGTPEKITFLHK